MLPAGSKENEMEMGTTTKIPQPTATPSARDVLDELRATRRELAALRRLFDEFAGVYINARFPYGKPTDRWARR